MMANIRKRKQKEMKNEKEERAKTQHLAIQSFQFHVTGDCRAINSTTTSVLSLSVLNLLLNYSIAWTRVDIVAVLAFLNHCISKAARNHYIFAVD